MNGREQHATGFLAELRRRNVFRAGLAWLALSWLLIAIADLLFPAFGFPDEVVRWLIIGLALRRCAARSVLTVLSGRSQCAQIRTTWMPTSCT